MEDKDQPCICGHKKYFNSWAADPHLCSTCVEEAAYIETAGKLGEAFHEFQLDNLKYIEQEAKQRNLI